MCPLVALHLAEGKDCLMVGNLESGYIVAPHSAELHAELDARCEVTSRAPAEWVRMLRYSSSDDAPKSSEGRT